MIARSRSAPAVLACVVGAFVTLLALVLCHYQPLLHVDRSLVDTVHSVALRHATWTATMRTVSRVGAPLTWFTVLAPVFVLLIRKQRFRLAAWVGATAAGSPVLNSLVKVSVHRPHPVLAHPVASAAGWSFPSGHAQAATVGCAILAALAYPLLRSWWRVLVIALAAVVATLIAFSRVALGVHFPSDVVAGIALGASWVLLTHIVVATSRPRLGTWCRSDTGPVVGSSAGPGA